MEAPDHSVLADAVDLEGLMDALGVKEAILVGSSYGGFTALALGVRAVERIRAIAAVEPPMMKFAEMFEDTRPVAAAFRANTVIPSREAFEHGDDVLGTTLLTGGIANRDPVELPPEVMERRRQDALAGRRVALSSDEFPLLDPTALEALSCPTLLLRGQNTAPIFQAIFKGVTRCMPRAKTAIVDNAGHSVASDQPESFNRLVMDFLGV